jgi:hypothetical protein
MEERPNQEEVDPGYKPIDLEYRDGHFWMPNGVRFDPDFKVIPEPNRIALFIEYERTFGRGKAFEITHEITEESRNPEVIEKYGGYDMKVYFDKFSYSVPIVTEGGGDEEMAQKLIKQLKEFRLKFSQLYEDANEHEEPGHLY